PAAGASRGHGPRRWSARCRRTRSVTSLSTHVRGKTYVSPCVPGYSPRSPKPRTTGREGRHPATSHCPSPTARGLAARRSGLDRDRDDPGAAAQTLGHVAADDPPHHPLPLVGGAAVGLVAHRALGGREDVGAGRAADDV